MRRNARLLAAGFALLLVTATATPASAATASDTYEANVIAYTNAARKAAGRAPVSPGWCVDRYAENWVRVLAWNDLFKHQDLGRVLEACDRARVTENIARGYPTAKAAVDAWLASPGHRANLLDAKVRWVGVGAWRKSNGTWYVVQVFGG